ncbi:MAG: hypothetical protein AAF213_06845, partial [Pseudomonadota bacterium]
MILASSIHIKQRNMAALAAALGLLAANIILGAPSVLADANAHNPERTQASRTTQVELTQAQFGQAQHTQFAQLGTTAPQPGALPTPTAQAAIGIRQEIERWLLDILPPGSANAETVKLNGQVVVEPFGERYAVTLPDLTVNLPNGFSIPFGTLTLSLRPETPVTYAVAMRLPTKVTVIDQAGDEVGLFEMGRQRLRGVWDTRFQTMTSLNLSVSDVEFRLRNEQSAMQLRFMLAGGTLESTGQADETFRLSGPSKLSLNEFELRDANGTRQQFFANMLAEFELRGLDMINFNRFLRRFQGLAQAFIPSASGDLPERETQDLLLKQLERELVDLPAMLQDFGMAVKVTGLVGNNPETSRGYSVDDLEYTLLARDLNTDVSRMQLTYSHKGFSFLPAFQGPGITPGEISLEIDVEGIPNRELWATAVALPNDMSVYGIQPAVNYAVEKIFHSLALANTSIELKEAFVNSEEVDARISGSALFDNGAAYKGVGAANIRLIGMDELVSRLTASTQNNPLEIGLLLGLRSLQNLGRVGDPIGGRTNREYDLRLDSRGSLQLNRQGFFDIIDVFLGRSDNDDDAG